jgi:hypothetical protein
MDVDWARKFKAWKRYGLLSLQDMYICGWLHHNLRAAHPTKMKVVTLSLLAAVAVAGTLAVRFRH